ncbi:ArsR/SmtB family transcription factor [Devriesea agamarum]|uniref:ArsR/SmtB family transcription factor n=1 Tax=Devriesea agamarum TaxID=472569 RepID=UPI00071CA270|nr:helix-turn-helix domain-containing protein [Devriesea agamarum]
MPTPLSSTGEEYRVAEAAACLADLSRARLIIALCDGRSLPASYLAAEAGVTPSTMSGHLKRLQNAGFVESWTSGRHRYYRLTNERIGEALETLAAIVPGPPAGLAHSLSGSTRLARLKTARTCYDHAAGELGTGLFRGIVAEKGLVRTDGDPGTRRGPNEPVSATLKHAPYEFGDRAEQVFTRFGVDLPSVLAARRPALKVCVDWTEQAHHLAGGLGAALLTSLLERGLVKRRSKPRELVLTDAGHAELDQYLQG